MPQSTIQHGFPGQVMMVIPRPVIRRALVSSWPVKLFPSDAGYFPTAQRHRVDRPKGAPELILIYCIQGKGWATIKDQNYQIGSGQLLMIPPGVAHAYGSDSELPWSIYWLHAAGDLAHLMAVRLCSPPNSSVIAIHDSFKLIALFDELLAEFSHGYGLSQLSSASAILTHLFGVITSQQSESAQESDSLERVAQVIRYMHQSWKGQVRVSELAERSNLSVSHFCELFKKKTGFPPLDYFLRVKIQRACELLATTQLSVKQISIELGIRDPLYFSRIFSRIQGCPPTDYRKMMQSTHFEK